MLQFLFVIEFPLIVGVPLLAKDGIIHGPSGSAPREGLNERTEGSCFPLENAALFALSFPLFRKRLPIGAAKDRSRIYCHISQTIVTRRVSEGSTIITRRVSEGGEETTSSASSFEAGEE